MFHTTIAEFLGNRPWYQWKLERYIAEENEIHNHPGHGVRDLMLWGGLSAISVYYICFIFQLIRITYA